MRKLDFVSADFYMLGKVSMSALMLAMRKVSLQRPSVCLITYLTAFNIHLLALLEALFLRRALRDLHLSKAGPETLSPQFFPRSVAAPRGRSRSKKLL